MQPVHISPRTVRAAIAPAVTAGAVLTTVGAKGCDEVAAKPGLGSGAADRQRSASARDGKSAGVARGGVSRIGSETAAWGAEGSGGGSKSAAGSLLADWRNLCPQPGQVIG
jgi:hypothetical protein